MGRSTERGVKWHDGGRRVDKERVACLEAIKINYNTTDRENMRATHQSSHPIRPRQSGEGERIINPWYPLIS